MPQILKGRCNFTLRWLPDLGNTSLEQNLKLKTLGYLLFIASIFLSAVWLPNGQFLTVIEEIVFDCYWGNSLTHPILLTAFGLPIFVPRVTGRGWGSTPNWVPSELWSQCLNPFSHTYKLQKILSADLHPVFIKCVNAQNTQKNYSLALWWPFGLQNALLDAKFRAQNFSFFWEIDSIVQVLGSKIFLKWGQCSKFTKSCTVQLTVSF